MFSSSEIQSAALWRPCSVWQIWSPDVGSPGPVFCVHTSVCVGKMATTSFLINKPSREGLFLEHLPCDMSASASVPGIFLEPLILTSPEHFQSEKERGQTVYRKMSDLLLCNVLNCASARGWDATTQMRTSGVPLLVFSLGAQPLTGRRCEHSKQKPGSLNRPLPRSRRQVVVAKRTVSASAQWAHCGPSGCCSARHVLA